MPPLDEVNHRFDAQALTVCHVGNVTALKFQLKRGSVLIQVPTDRFCAKAQAKTDDNGVPWPVHEIDLAPVISWSPHTTERRIPGVSFSPEREAALERAWIKYSTDLALPLAQIAREIAEQDATLTHFFSSRYPTEYIHARKERTKYRDAERAVRVKDRTVKVQISEARLQIAFREYYERGKDRDVIAAELGLSPIALSVRFFRLRRKLQLKNERRSA